MPVYGLGTVIATLRISERYEELSHALTDSNEFAEKSSTSSPHTRKADQYSEDDDESDEDDDLDEYWDLDELGVDPEEFYDLCRNCTSPRP